jgi:Ca2+-binding RTX toxin-like protein
MAITGIPATAGDDVVTVTPIGHHSVNADAGNDILVLNYASLSADIRYQDIGGGWFRYTDDVRSTMDFINFDRFDLRGGSGEDVLVGRDGIDTLSGGGGNDHLASGLGADIISGGAGQDRWSADYASFGVNVTVTLLALGTATVGGSGAQVTGIEALSLITGAGDDRIDTSAFVANDVIYAGDGNDVVNLGRGGDSANGWGGTDTLVMDWSALTDVNAHIFWNDIGGGWGRYVAAGGDRLDYHQFEKFVLTGGAGSDVLYGGGLNDNLTGNDGNDHLDSGTGVDTVSGGNGVDTWRVDTSARAGNTTIDLESQTTNFGAVLSGIERLQFTGGNGADRITGRAGVNNDSFTTGTGSDTVTTGRGVDSANAGDTDGTDTLVMDWSGITDIRHGISITNIGGGWNRYASASGDRLDYYGFEVFKMTGGAGDDRLNGGALADTLVGGTGDDLLNSDTGGGTITGGDGSDRWQANLSAFGNAVFSATASQTAAQMTGIALSVTGIESLDLTTGNGRDNISTAGYAFNDGINTSGGNDTVNTGLGLDWVNAGDDIDVLVADYSSAVAAVNQVDIGGGWWRVQMADGTSRIDYYAVERYALTGGHGNDTLSGAALADTLEGGDGDDSLNSGRGSDVVRGGAGVDTWNGDYSNLGVNLGFTLSASGAGKVIGVGTTVTGIENVTIATGSGADTINLSATAGNDNVITGDGNDIINMGRGRFESLNAGGGIDTVTISFVDAVTGIRMFDIGGGSWRAASTGGDYRFDFYGVETFNITSGGRSDRINGFGGADTLSSGGATDFLDGGRGSDVLTGGGGADVFVFSDIWNAGVDLITDAAVGDLLRMNGVGLSGAMQTGNGATLLGGQMDLSVSGGETTLHLGLDGTAGADFSVRLTGVFSAADFLFSGSDVLLV